MYEKILPTTRANSGVKYMIPMCVAGAINNPTKAPYNILKNFVGGVVRGSVSIIAAKNIKGESLIERAQRAGPVKISETIKNDKTKSQRFIFRTIKKPPMITIGKMFAFPTHQVALLLIAMAVTATEIATGLKMCFLPIFKINLDATMSSAANPRKIISGTDFGGLIIRPRIKAEMIQDSTLACASKTFEKT